ncbi:hypothetical protein GTA51_13125 [Desulfovibrio aerotolerans]|uniref:Uncharacterized protein n=1 Tax=Solidesulfovibrio aerotolerans TaxID=295255 RepID=A0A7C9N2U9_9BACT|nr:hypothetical protein [Solidesulfovibrio aerotolerans]MYL84071.1 hypothetical protein [Solidesulfovibrio aerotolerans]
MVINLFDNDSLGKQASTERTILNTGHRSSKEHSSYEVIEILKDYDIKELILHIQSPEIDGIELTIKTTEIFRRLDAIALSADSHLIKDALSQNFAKQLVTKFSFTKLLEEQDLLDELSALLDD